MKKLPGYIFLALLLFGGFCAVVTSLSISRSIDTAANLAAQELQRPPASSEVISQSLENRLYLEEKGGGFLSFFGGLSLVALAIGGLFGFYWVKSNYLRQKRLTHRAMKEPNTIRRVPRVTIPTSRQLTAGEEENDYDQTYR